MRRIGLAVDLALSLLLVACSADPSIVAKTLRAPRVYYDLGS